MNEILKRRIVKDAYFLLAVLIGVLAIFSTMDLEARILGAFLMAYGLTRFGYDSEIERLEREIDELKNN